MLKTATDRGEEILNSPPSRTEESLKEYIKNLKTARRELFAELNDPRNVMGGSSLTGKMKTSSILGEVENNLLTAESVLEAIRNEIPQEEVVETDKLGELDVQASVEKLAVASAVSTLGLNRFQRLSKGLHAFTQEIEPQLDPEFRDFPRQQYTARLEELIAMDNNKLAAESQKAFPTKEWIGPDPEPVGGEGDLGYIPSHFEKDETTAPESKDTDGEFDAAIEKERKFRGIDRASKDAKDASVKKADIYDSVPDMNKNLDPSNPGTHSPNDSEFLQTLIDNIKSDPSFREEVKDALGLSGDIDFGEDPLHDPQYEGSRESFSDTVTNDAGETRWAKKSDATNSTPGSHEPASSSDGGAQLQAEPPDPEDAFEKTIEEEGNKSTGAPRGPNRRESKDVPAYSTPKSQLTASFLLQKAAELASNYENMDDETALQIVKTVFANDESEDEAEEKADENATGSGEESSENDQVDNDNLDGLFDD